MGQFLNVANLTCLSCSVAIPYCTRCLFAGQCTVCQPGYFVNSSLLCEIVLCPTVTNCNICQTTTTCYQCDYASDYYVDMGGTCSLCDNNLNMFINASSTQHECVNCSQVSCGPSCPVGQFLNVANLTCLNCSVAIPYCTQCLFAGQCTQCEIGYYVNSTLLC